MSLSICPVLHRDGVGAVLMCSTKQCRGHPLTIWCLQDGRTPLFYAARSGFTEAVRQLLSVPGINANAADKVNALGPLVGTDLQRVACSIVNPVW
jgi:hypothetical protein